MTITDQHDTSNVAMFDERSGRPIEQPTPWRPMKVSGAEIDALIERLAAAPVPSDGYRGAGIVHPESTGAVRSFAPAIDVTVEVLLPGESTAPLRRNSSQVVIGIRGSGQVDAGGRTIDLARWDVCNIPSMRPYRHRNTSGSLWARLTYTNFPLLSRLGVGYAEALQDYPTEVTHGEPASSKYNRTNAPDFAVSDLGSRVRGYEYLTDIEVVENNAQHWPWAAVAEHLSSELGDGKRLILAYYNPATERRNGATHSFFVTATQVPAGFPPFPTDRRGHRHSSTAINYHFCGTGSSVVDGHTIEWGPGDLLLSAPGWREHLHQPGPDGIGVFTVQDHPLHIGMESLIWQEDMTGPILTLGAEAGVTGYVGPREAGE
jgi:gentisate 1,2-dioxygenase